MEQDSESLALLWHLGDTQLNRATEKVFQLLAFFLMHFVCVYTAGRNVWLLLKYYLHGFAEEKAPYNSQHIKFHGVVMVWGLCIWGYYLDTLTGLTKALKGTLNLTSWTLNMP